MPSSQQLTVFLNMDTHEELSRMRRKAGYEDDDLLIRDALHALRREWEAGRAGSGIPPRGFSLPSRDDEIFHRRANHSPQDYDT